MTNDYCYGLICFIPLDVNAPRFFGFSEFLASLALMVLAWSIADVRYRFRVRTTPLPLQGLTFTIVGILGILTLLTDLWRAEGWLVPRGNIVTPAGWQAILGGLFLLTFLTWAWFAFIRPSVYGKWNYKRYAQTLYRVVLKGDPSELSVVADEFSRSARAVIDFATDGTSDAETTSMVTNYANSILILIADKRFCRVIVESSPGTALAVFQGIRDTRKYGVPIGTFAKNIVNEALLNKNSFLFHEAEGYESGLLGYQKPLSQAMFSNYRMVEDVGTLLDLDIWRESELDAAQWKAYCRVALMTFRDYVEQGAGEHSYVLFRTMGHMERAVSDLYKLDRNTKWTWDDDVHGRIYAVVDFIKKAIDILGNKGFPQYIRLRVRSQNLQPSIYDDLAEMIFKVIFSVSCVQSPVDRCWWVQHNAVWANLFQSGRLNEVAGKVVRFKVHRLIYDEIKKMKEFPDFKRAQILGFCFNVLGFVINEQTYCQDKALQKAVLSWTKKNFAWLYFYKPKVGEACLVDGITYDAEHSRLVKTYPAEGLRQSAHHIYFEVNSPPEKGSS